MVIHKSLHRTTKLYKTRTHFENTLVQIVNVRTEILAHEATQLNLSTLT
jgi:hypothetical protein